jgi:hypothetical protein
MSLPPNKPQLLPWTEPPPMSAGAPCPAIRSSDQGLLCAYFISPAVVSEDSVSILKFEVVLQFRFGYPNEDALGAVHSQSLG